MIKAAAAPFKTKRIHIGMDEAWKLGQGNYLKLHGYRKKIDIMSEYLGRVLQITDRLGLRPMIWSDMYFRGASKPATIMTSRAPQSRRYRQDAQERAVCLLGLLPRRARVL